MMTVPGASRVGYLTIWRFSRAGNSAVVPSSSDGADCTTGGAYAAGGSMKKGNNCRGAAEAAPETTTAPIASAPKPAARRESNLNAPKVNILRLPFDCLRATFWCVVERILNGNTFPDVFAKAPKWFHPIHELFHSDVVGAEKERTECEKEGVNLHDVTRLKYP